MDNNYKRRSLLPLYENLLGEKDAQRALKLFDEIEGGKYDKKELHSFNVRGLSHPVSIRAIRADMQSFVNTFIDPYMENKPYLSNPKFVVDGGANIGCTAALYASWWPNSKIVSIEADKENYELTVLNTKNYPNVSVIHGGLWNKTADLKIEAGQEDGFVVREVSSADHVASENITKGVSLGDLMKRSGASGIDFLKLNVEGSEKEIFASDYESWLGHTKAMLIELHDGKNAGCSSTVFKTVGMYDFAVAETANYGVLFVKQALYRAWYAEWYRENIYKPNINKTRFPEFYLDKESG